MAEISGAEVLLEIESPEGSGTFVVLGAQTNVSFAAQGAEIDVSSKDSPESKFITGRFSQTLTLDKLYLPGETEFGLMKLAMRNRRSIVVRRRELGSPIETADAVITSMTENFPDNAAATINCQLRVASPWAAV